MVQFFERATKQKVDDTQDILQTKEVLKGTDLLIGFTKKPDPSPENSEDYSLDLDVLRLTKAGDYELFKPIEACSIEGGNPRVESVFYVNVDKDDDNEIGVICSWPVHSAADCDLAPALYLFDLESSGRISRIEKKEIDAALFYEKKPFKKATYTCRYPHFKNGVEAKAIIKKLNLSK